jgi:hypothetical protein
MDSAEQLRKDAIPFTPRAVSSGAEAPLQIAANPFVAGASGSRMGRPLQTAFGEVVRQIGQQTPVVVVVGSAGTGKSMLMDVTARACVGMGLSVRRVERGDLVQVPIGQKSDVLLVDQTDSMSNTSLQTLLSPSGKDIATTMVFLCLPSSVCRFSFSGTNAAVVELTPLALSDARNYLQERAASIGRSHLFTPEALDLIIDGSRGLPRLLRSIAQLAFFGAASEGASQIGTQHVNNALASRVTYDPRDDIDRAATARLTENAPRVGSAPTPDALPIPVRVEMRNREMDAAAQEKPSAKESGVPSQVGQGHAIVAQALVPVPHPAGDLKAQIVVPSVPAVIRSTPPAVAAAPAQPLKLPVAGRNEESRRSQGRWISRSVGITGALVVSFAVAGVISSNLTSKNQSSPTPAPAFPVAAKPVDLSKAVVQQAAPAKQPTNPTASGQGPDRSPAERENAAAETTKAPAPAVRAQVAVPSRNNAVTGVAAVPARANKAAEDAAARKLADDKARAEREAADHIKSAVDQRAVVQTTQQAPDAADAAVQAASLKAAEEKAAADRVIAERLSAGRIAEEKAAAEKAAVDRAKAAEVAALQAQQAATLAQEQQTARQAKAAKDLADKALKDASDREKAEKEADEQYKAERREANKVFSHTLFGFSR